MTNKHVNLAFLVMIKLFLAGLLCQNVQAQSPEIQVSGVVVESGSGLPLNQVFISATATGAIAQTDEDGTFTIAVPDLNAELIIDLPGYIRRRIFLQGRETLEISLVSSDFRSFDDIYFSPMGELVLKEASYALQSLSEQDVRFSSTTSFDQALTGRIPGLRVIRQSGMPGQRTYMNIRGYSSLYAHSEPLIFIDGMIYDYAYANVSLMEGFALNPMDVVDLEDITDITVMKDGLSFLGASGANGAVYVNTEQKAEASTVIRFSSYGGVSMTPNYMNLLNAEQFTGYFNEMLHAQGYNADQINAKYPWLSGNTSAPEFYRYNNNTDWQDQIFRPAAVTKHHFFLKGGDEIATYNLSTGYQRHNGIYENSYYNRFNLRVNGTVNITNRFTITPNVKLSVADSHLANHGPSEWKNPVLSSMLIPANMAPNARDEATGEFLNYLDDVGVFEASNPVSIVENALGINRNYHFLSSVTARYSFSDNLGISTLVGINYNNARENIFLPNLGLIQVDSAYNSPGDFIYEFRSTQNHTALHYNRNLGGGHSIRFDGGLRYVANSYKHNLSLDLNTPSDDFKRLGQGAQFSYLRSTTGDNRGLTWVSYYTNAQYSFRNRYFLATSLSFDGNSATNSKNRHNFFPSVAAAWRLSSEPFLSQQTWMDDLKIRGSYSLTGNMFSSVYDYSKLYYTTRRMNTRGVLTREVIPNENLELEKKSTVNAGLDLSILRQRLNMHVDVYQARVDNLIMQQTLPPTFGFTSYYDNGGKLQTTGIEFAANTRMHLNNLVWTFGASITLENTEITELNFLNPNERFIITPVNGAAYITSVGNPVNAFYGFRTDGILSEGEAGTVIGPKGRPMQAGDVRFVDTNGDNVINEDDKVIIGDPNPDYFGYLFTGFTFRNFELFAFLNYSVGNDIYNFVRHRAESMDGYINQSTAVLDRWTPNNPGASMPRASYGDPTGNNVFSDRWIEDGSYLRLQQLTLNYMFPPVPGLFNKGITIYLTATNLLTITNYSGYDPEFMYINSPFYMGIDYGKVPQTRSFILGLKLDL